MKPTKFLFIKEGEREGTLIAEDGSVAGFHHNDENILGTHYGRINFEILKRFGKNKALDTLYNGNDDRDLFDFEGYDYITPTHLEEVANWMIFTREGEFLDNLEFIEEKDFTNEKLLDFLKENKELIN